MQAGSETELVVSILNIWMAEEAMVKWHERAAERMPIEAVYPRIVADLAEENIFEKTSPYYDQCVGKRLLEHWKKGMAAAGDPYPGQGDREVGSRVGQGSLPMVRA